MKRWLLIGLVLSLAGVVLVGYALLTPSVTESGGAGTQGSGQSQARYSYPQVNIVLSIVGSVMATGGGALLFSYRKENVGLPIIVNETPSVRSAAVTEVPTSKKPEEAEKTSAVATQMSEGSSEAQESNLVLRLLEGDERAMFRAVLDKGGEALQKDLVVATKMSDTKASRVLDRLVEKGVIYKERHGMTNKIRIRIDR